MGLTIVVGADIAGVNYKETLKADLEADERVTKVIDVGVSPGQDIDYPHVAVDAAKKVAAGEADRALLVCGTGMGMAIAANKASVPRSPMTASPSNAWSCQTTLRY